MTGPTPTYDVAVIGSGIGGSVLALILASQGVKVVMIDAGTHPRFAVGESTIPHTSLLGALLGEQYGVPELETLAYPDRIADEVCSTCGIKRVFGFAYHRAGEEHRPSEALLVGTSSKDEVHLFRQDIDAWLASAAVRRGVDLRQQTAVETVAIDDSGVCLATSGGEIRARYVVDATGVRSVLAGALGLREQPTRFRHHSRSVFTHMIDVDDFDRGSSLGDAWSHSTLHHVFDGGWIWVIPFNNRPGSTNPLVSVGLTVDPRVHPRSAGAADDEFRSFVSRLPSVARQFADARTVRPWISTDRLQYSSRAGTGSRWALMSHAYGAVDPLYSRGLVNTLEVTAALVPPLLAALGDDDFSVDRFAAVDAVHRRVSAYNDELVHQSFVSWRDFDLWNAWMRVWALGTLPLEFRLMTSLSHFTATRDPQYLHGSTAEPKFSDFEDPDYARFFDESVAVMERFSAGEVDAAAAAADIFSLANRHDFPIDLHADAMKRAGWMSPDGALSERMLEASRSGFRWALGNPESRNLFGSTENFLRWRGRESDPRPAAPG